MYLPPNGAANAAFLETLRLLLVHETPAGLELAFSTPRAWLAAGKRVAVTNAPTAFGPVSFAIETHARFARRHRRGARPRHGHDAAPAPPSPGGERIGPVTLGGRPYRRVDAATGTIDLSGRSGTSLRSR